jgi:hypothetical protein
MPPINLVALAASLREALDAPLVVESDADREARLDIIDMIPVLNRKFVGEVQTIRDMAWEVHVPNLLLALVISFREQADN